MLETPYRLVSDRRPPQLLQRWLPIGLAVASALLLAEVGRLRTENGKLRLSLERHAPHPPHAVFEEAAPHEGSCTCEAAQRSPLFLEYAYRSGLCPGAPAALGPSWTTEDCLQDVWGEYNAGGDFNGARPVLFNASVAGKHAVFEGVRWAQIPAGEVTEAWACNQANGCLDCPPSDPNQGCSEARGAAMVWVPEGASSRTPRILYVHGGSWETNSPVSASYAPFGAMIAKTTRMAVLVIDYTLAPLATHKTMLAQVGRATRWLATHDVRRLPPLAPPPCP